MCMKEYLDNLIGKDSSEMNCLDKQIREQYPKAIGWLPIEVYDLVQCGYPYPDHGEMIHRVDGGTDVDGNLLPPTGMWCKVSDVRKLLEDLSFEDSDEGTLFENVNRIIKLISVAKGK
jgi:hypothetical protein